MKQIYKGTVITSKSLSELTVMENAYVIVEDGIIADVKEELKEEEKRLEVIDFQKDLIIPAFSDLHIHAPQYNQRGIGMDALLFDWLNNYTFPNEARYKEYEFARKIYAQLIRDMLRNGSLQASLFTTIHYEASDLLFHMLMDAHMDAYLAKVNMDRNSPDYYVETTEKSLEETERFVAEHLHLSKNIKPILTPRFAPTCSKELMLGLGEIAKKYDVGVQTHLVESKAESAWTKQLFPEYNSDGRIYEMCHLLEGKGPHIFAHVIFPEEEEYRILKEYDCISVHCPDATNNVIAGIMPAKQMAINGYKIAMGTDVGGGHFMGVYTQIAKAIQLSKMKEFYEETDCTLHLKEAFYMATVNGGEAFDRVGKIEKGYRFQALVISGFDEDGYTLSPLEKLERFCYTGTYKNIKKRYANGIEIDPDRIYEDLLRKYQR